jgi:hypothetical protein
MNRKAELREIVLDIVFKREHVTYDPYQFEHLALGVAEILNNRASRPARFQGESQLNESDWLLINEIFWDLIVERVITLGFDRSNSEYPFFRLSSHAQKNLEEN